MTTRDTAFAPGTPCWVDLLSSDADGAKAFYGGLFGWAFEDGRPEFGGYANITSDGHRVGGLMANSAEMGSPDVWTTYLSTADLDATVASATAASATVLTGPMPVADLGTMAVLMDPAGAVVGLWQAGTHTGFGKYNEPGSVTWDEHHSKDFAASMQFYEKVFGWTVEKVSDTDEFRYYLGQVDGTEVACMMDSKGFLPPEVPSHWAVYFSVEDVDEAQAKAVELGATVVRPAMDSPYGRMAEMVDPTGAGFNLHSAKLANPAAAQPTGGQ